MIKYKFYFKIEIIYYQWYFLEEDKRTSRSLEIEANRWAKIILDYYYNEYLTNI